MKLSSKIQYHYDSLSKTNKKIADFVLMNKEMVVKQNVAQFAEASDASGSAIIRFIKIIGYKSFEAFKIDLVKELESFDVNLLDPIVDSNDDLKCIAEKLFNLVFVYGRETKQYMDLKELERAVNALKKAKTIFIFGIGTSALPAMDFYHKLKRIGIHANYESDYHTMIEICNNCKKNDVFLGISYSGQTTEVLYLSKICKMKGASIISITRENLNAPLCCVSDIHLFIPSSETMTRVSAIPSKYNMFQYIDILYLSMIKDDMNEIEKLLVETSELTRSIKKEDCSEKWKEKK